ncbi:class I heat shock protein [Striga asiatica]|uniref:Class I heat shock protein n=1 Tax=Striga asiatica TaxID=4170 RepID=A0A5A7QWQ2_STRAF|nr:class I heat shock protein [Striga asiatica]
MSLISNFFAHRQSNVFDPFSRDIKDPFEGFPFSSTMRIRRPPPVKPRVKILSSYGSLSCEADYSKDITQMKTNKNVQHDSMLDLLNPSCTKELMIEEHSRNRLLSDKQRNRHDAFFAYDAGLIRLITNWKNVSRIAASDLSNEVEPLLLATYQLKTRDGNLITNVRKVRHEIKLIGHVTLMIEG